MDLGQSVKSPSKAGHHNIKFSSSVFWVLSQGPCRIFIFLLEYRNLIKSVLLEIRLIKKAPIIYRIFRNLRSYLRSLSENRFHVLDFLQAAETDLLFYFKTAITQHSKLRKSMAFESGLVKLQICKIWHEKQFQKMVKECMRTVQISGISISAEKYVVKVPIENSLL